MNAGARRPDFFVVGAPTFGATALGNYLRQHPRVFFSVPKEPHYFATDLPRYRLVTRASAYLELFRAAGPHHTAVGEGPGGERHAAHRTVAAVTRTLLPSLNSPTSPS